MVGSSYREERPANINAPAHPQRWQMVVSSSSDDDGLVAPPSPRDGMPPPVVPVRAETREMRRMWQATATMPGGVRVLLAAMTHVTPASIAWTAPEAPEITVTPPMVTGQEATVVPVAARMTPVATVEAPSGSSGGPTGSRQGCRFRVVQWES